MIAIQDDFGFRRWEPGTAAVVQITGFAQVNGLRGETDAVEKMQARIECDLEYLRRWSPLFDLSIALKTISAILSRKNAY